ncbi:MFS transporter [Candidatus Peregrinibacteria bacterium]|nr:MFS transporter [Candidatus Peregrinibacteria bacterium]
MSRKNVALWTLYDFANSIVTVVFFLYFSQWLVVDRGMADIWYNMLFTAGSVLLLFTAPLLGAIADRTGRERTYLNRVTILGILCFTGASVTAVFFPQHFYIAAAFFLFANYFYQFSFGFYNALLHFIAPPQKWGTISGVGQAGNWLGQIAGLLISLPLAIGAVYLVGEAGRAQTFLPATLLSFLLALPMLLWFRLPRHEHKDSPIIQRVSLVEEYRNQWSRFRKLLKAPNMGLFLLAYFFFNDAIITASNNFPIFLENVFSVSDQTKSLLLLGILVTSVIGALCSGFAADRTGLKKALLIVLGGWMVIFPLLGITTNFPLFVSLCTLMGFLFGATWTVTRAAMTALCPKDQLNFGFSFYTLAERVSTLVGPLTWGLITSLFAGLGPVRYRLAVLTMTFFVIAGFFIVQKISITARNRDVS